MKILAKFASILRLIIIGCGVLFTASSVAQSPFKALQGLGDPQYHKVTSKKPDQIYHLFVRLPTNYDSKASYPTVYLLDGGITFPLLAAYYQYLHFGEEVPEMILVGISYGSNDHKTGNNRSRDYTAKSTERSYWGGAEAFQNVLAKNIIPLVENHYGADPKQRILFGQSLGGQFVLYTAITKPELFAGYIASNPALHRNLDFFLQDTAPVSKGKTLAKLFVSDGANDDPRFRVPALKWMKHWNNKPQRPWLLKTITLDGQSHMSAAPSAFRQGIRWIFGGQQ